MSAEHHSKAHENDDNDNPAMPGANSKCFMNIYCPFYLSNIETFTVSKSWNIRQLKEAFVKHLCTRNPSKYSEDMEHCPRIKSFLLETVQDIFGISVEKEVIDELFSFVPIQYHLDPNRLSIYKLKGLDVTNIIHKTTRLEPYDDTKRIFDEHVNNDDVLVVIPCFVIGINIVYNGKAYLNQVTVSSLDTCYSIYEQVSSLLNMSVYKIMLYTKCGIILKNSDYVECLDSVDDDDDNLIHVERSVYM
eukprot:146997_1